MSLAPRQVAGNPQCKRILTRNIAACAHEVQQLIGLGAGHATDSFASLGAVARPQT